jgi:putative peptidoglycan lipid II flippase
MVPVSAFFMVFSKTIIASLFAGGKFDAYSVAMTSRILTFYSIGLCAYGAVKILQSCFFALKDTMTPTKVSAVALVVNIICNTLLMFPMQAAGLALATSLSGFSSFIMLYVLLKRRLHFDPRPLLVSFLRIVLASSAMAGTCFYVHRYILLEFLSGPGWKGIVSCGILFCIAAISYIFYCFIFRVPELYEMKEWYARRRRPPVKNGI